MPELEALKDLTFNRGPIADPEAFARETEDAPFTHNEELKAWVAQGLDELR